MLKIYTDGACSGNPGPGGWAFVIPELSYEESGYIEDTTNNRMEIFSIVRALKYLSVYYPDIEEIEIITDSQYVVNTMTKGWKKNKNNDLWAILEANLYPYTNVVWTWVKGHADNPYNKRCDELAVAEYKTYQNVIAKARPVGTKTVFEQIKEMSVAELAEWFYDNVEWINCLLDCADSVSPTDIQDLLNSPNAFEK